MRNYKSLDAYKYFVDGWVLETLWKFYSTSDTFLLIGKVQHFYALRETPLKPWVAIRKNGMVECGHCTCMAGLAETCSHVAAILFWLETAIHVHKETTCTSKPNSWLPPSLPTARQKVPFITMEELDGEDSCAEKTEHMERYKPYSEMDRDRQTSTHCPGVRGIVQGS